jgi:polyferredoxin
MVLFFILSIIDIKFALFGLVCMLAPLYQALRGKGKVHCSHYCPRGSFLGKFLKPISMDNSLPVWMRGEKFKNSLMILMFTVFGVSLYLSGGDLNKMAFAVLRLIIVSSVFAIMLGLFFKPRAWCQVCPMGHITGKMPKK